MLRCKETDEPFVKRDGKFFPTPHGQLELIDEDGEVAVIYWDRTVRMNSRDDAFAKAERICRAVNLHEELVAACEAAYELAAGDRNDGDDVAAMCRAALAKARKEPANNGTR